MLLFLITTCVLFISFYLLFSDLNIKSLSEKILSATLLTSAQIVLIETILGSLKLLSINYIAIVSLAISFSLVLYIVKTNSLATIKTDIYKDLNNLHQFTNHIKSPYIIFLLILVCFIAIWILLSAILLPPRGIDDLTYHLPAIYEYFINQKIFLLPTEYRGHFAFPMNAELLFLWPVIYFKTVTPIGLVQFSYGMIGILAVYTLGRQLELRPSTSAIAGVLFFLTPVTLTQAGVGYIDLIVSVFFLISLYYCIRFYTDPKQVYLFLAGISIGLIVGMKYTMIPIAILLQIIIAHGLPKKPTKNIFIYFALIFIFCSYWYLRNIYVFANPVYPIDVFSGSHEYESISQFSITEIFSKIKAMIELLFFKDTGLGSFHGGFGIIFWAMAIPAWFYFLIKSLKIKDESRRKKQIFIWLQLLVGFFILFLVPLYKFHRSARLAIFMVPIGLLAVGKLIEFYDNNKIYKNIVLFCCCIFSALSVFSMARAKLPSYAIDAPIYDLIDNKDYSKQRYLRPATTSTAFLFETLDYITKDYKIGVDCYFASSLMEYVGPIYGSNLQNRVWNFKKDKSNPPDALIFLVLDEQPVKYYGKKITLDDTADNNKYILVDIAEKAYLFFNEDLITKESTIRKALIKHYENYYDKEIKVATFLQSKIGIDNPIITSDYYGIGFQYLKFINKSDNDVHIILENKVPQLPENMRENGFYSINKRYDHYDSVLKFSLRLSDTERVKLYHNSIK